KGRRLVPGVWHGQLSPLPSDAVEAETGPLAAGVGGSGALEALGDRRPRQLDPWSPERVDEHRLPPGAQEPQHLVAEWRCVLCHHEVEAAILEAKPGGIPNLELDHKG